MCTLLQQTEEAQKLVHVEQQIVFKCLSYCFYCTYIDIYASCFSAYVLCMNIQCMYIRMLTVIFRCKVGDPFLNFLQKFG